MRLDPERKMMKRKMIKKKKLEDGIDIDFYDICDKPMLFNSSDF